ncbi:hypothetical protein QE152_g37696 [Popillia japonica]|uniref:Uncharacterized protein n=1 Tax=Popillia japonica TaxID=7064 RepID=A0AAW1I9F0_POPJA
MESITFDNLYASYNNGPIIAVEIVYYRITKVIHIYTYDNSASFIGMLLNQTIIDRTIENEIVIEGNNTYTRILFNTAEERQFFLNEIESDESSSSSVESSGDSAVLSQVNK